MVRFEMDGLEGAVRSGVVLCVAGRRSGTPRAPSLPATCFRSRMSSITASLRCRRIRDARFGEMSPPYPFVLRCGGGGGRLVPRAAGFLWTFD